MPNQIPKESIVLHNGDTPLLDSSGLPRWRTITPLWTIDGEIAPKYHEATVALANGELFSQAWHREQDSKFFWIRDLLIGACENAVAFDWQAAIDFHRLRRSLDSRANEIGRATRRFSKALAAAHPLVRAPETLAYYLERRFKGQPIEQFATVGILLTDALKVGLADFADVCAEQTGRGGGHFQFGPIHYHSMPKRLPKREVSLGLKLADVFTTWRIDGEGVRNVHMGRPPNLSAETPWSILTLFVDAAFENVNPTGSLQTLVARAVANGAKIG